MEEELISMVAARRGHFRLESGHHGNLWLDLDRLLLRPSSLRPFAHELAQRLSLRTLHAVCGPLTGGAFVAQLIAAELDVEFYYTERWAHPERDDLYSVEYHLPEALRGAVRGKRIAIVDDAITMGSAVRGTFADLEACGAQPVVIGALLLLGSSASSFAASVHIPLERIVSLPSDSWTPSACPLCASGTPLEHPTERRE